MRKKVLLIASFFLLFFSQMNAQREWGDPHKTRFKTEAMKDPAYIKFQGEVDALVKSANGTNTNAAAVKELFIRNKSLLQNLYRKAGLQEAEVTKAERKRPVYINPNAFSSVLKKYLQMPFQTSAIKTPPFDGSWSRVGFPNANMPYPFDTTGSNFTTGKITHTSNPCSTVNYCYLGTYNKGFMEKITVPSDPLILAAQIKFEYSFTYTGWDTYGSKAGIDVVVRASNNFNSTSYNALPDASPSYMQPTDRWKNAGILLPLDSITTDFGELHASVNSSFTIEGYVTPGSEVELMVGFAFPLGTNKGLNGCYHYGEFILKKITVFYFKSVN